MTKPHYKVVICTPAITMTVSYVRSLIKLIHVLEKENISWNYMSEASSHVAIAREKTAGGTTYLDYDIKEPFGNYYTYDKMIWIDSDIEFEPDDVMSLLNSDKDIVGGAYLLSDGSIPAMIEPGQPMMTYQQVVTMTKPVKVSSIGFGFLAIKSGVFESIEKPWFSEIMGRISDDVKYPIVGEDVAFCHRARQAGFEIWLDPAIRLNHQKTSVITWRGFSPLI